MILYMDNLAVHKSINMHKVYEELNITPIWTPVYSPEYNPIEYMFSKLKSKVKQLRLQDMVREVHRTYRELIPLAAETIKIKDCNAFIKHVMNIYKLSYED